MLRARMEQGIIDEAPGCTRGALRETYSPGLALSARNEALDATDDAVGDCILPSDEERRWSMDWELLISALRRKL
jgi:hypothetical protein